jgi:uncharacterized membrane protein YfcA
MSTSGTPRGALWLVGGTLATVLGAVANQIFHDHVIAVIVGVVVAVAFGAAIERMVEALNRRTGKATSPPSPPATVDEVRAGDQTG